MNHIFAVLQVFLQNFPQQSGKKMLVKIKGVYHFRKAVPSLLKGILGKHEIWQTLKTNDAKRALMLAKRIKRVLSTIEIDLKLSIISHEQALKRLIEIGISPKDKAKISFANNVESASSGFNNSIYPPIASQVSRLNLQQEFDLEGLFTRFSQERIDAKRWGLKTQLEYKASFNLFLRFCKETGTTEDNIDHKFLLSYRSTLQALPPNLSKKGSNQSLLNIASQRHSSTLSSRQVNKYLICLTGFFGWLFQHEFISKNPAHHLLLQKSKRPDMERDAYTVQEIELILQKTRKFDGAKRYIPLIAIYSGARMNEIAQAFLTDIITHDGILCLDINENKPNKRLKTASSERIIPIHKKVIDNGFMDYLNQIKLDGHERLFPELPYSPTNGYGDNFCRWFGTYNRREISSDKKKTFHSIRHSVSNQLKQAGVAPDLISELLGHKVHSISINRYSSRFSPKIMLEALLNLPW